MSRRIESREVELEMTLSGNQDVEWLDLLLDRSLQQFGAGKPGLNNMVKIHSIVDFKQLIHKSLGSDLQAKVIL